MSLTHSAIGNLEGVRRLSLSRGSESEAMATIYDTFPNNSGEKHAIMKAFTEKPILVADAITGYSTVLSYLQNHKEVKKMPKLCPSMRQLTNTSYMLPASDVVSELPQMPPPPPLRRIHNRRRAVARSDHGSCIIGRSISRHSNKPTFFQVRNRNLPVLEWQNCLENDSIDRESIDITKVSSTMVLENLEFYYLREAPNTTKITPLEKVVCDIIEEFVPMAKKSSVFAGKFINGLKCKNFLYNNMLSYYLDENTVNKILIGVIDDEVEPAKKDTNILAKEQLLEDTINSIFENDIVGIEEGAGGMVSTTTTTHKKSKKTITTDDIDTEEMLLRHRLQTSFPKVTMNEVVFYGVDILELAALRCREVVNGFGETERLPLTAYFKLASAIKNGTLFKSWTPPSRSNVVIPQLSTDVYAKHCFLLGLQNWGKLKTGQIVTPRDIWSFQH